MKYRIEVTATVLKHYEIDADNEKDAIAKTTDATPDFEEEINAEVTCVTKAEGEDLRAIVYNIDPSAAPMLLPDTSKP